MMQTLRTSAKQVTNSSNMTLLHGGPNDLERKKYELAFSQAPDALCQVLGCIQNKYIRDSTDAFKEHNPEVRNSPFGSAAPVFLEDISGS